MLLGFTSNLRIVSLSLLLSTLAACGGGGGSEGGGFINPPNSNDNTVPTYSLSIEALDSSGEASLKVTSQESLTLNVTVTSSDGTIPVNEVVQISTTVADIDPANGSAVIDANGIATFTLDFNGTEGAGAVVASFTANGSTVEASINIESVLIREQYILTLDTTNAEGLDTNRFSALSPLTASLTLTESDGVTPVMDALVSLSTTIGTVAPELGTKLTDETGVARFTVNFADIEGAGALVGGYESDTLSLTVQKNIEAIASSSAYTLIIDEIPNNGVVTSAVDVSGSVRLLTANSSQYPVGNQIIELSSSLVDITPSNRRVRTDADGVANFVMSYKGIVGAGELSANFSRDDESATAVTAIETQVAVSEPSAGVVTSLALATFTADGVPSREFSAAQPLTLQVTMVDAFGDVVPTSGQVIELSSDVATITPDNGSAVTANGIATFGLEFNGTIGAGLAQATLNVGETSYIGSTAIQAISETPFLISLDRSGGALSVTNQIDVVATLTTPDGTPVENAILAFESDIATVSPATAVSDAQGSAAASVSFDGESGAGTFTATYELDGEVFSNSFNFDAVQIEPPYSLDFSLTSGGVDVTNTGRFTDLEPLTVVVTLTDEAGEAVVGERIVLSSNIGVVANPENAEAVTDDNGNAEFSIESDGASGAGALTARYDSPLGSVTATKNIQAVIEDTVYNLDITSVTNDGVISDGQPITLTAVLTSSDPTRFPVRFQNIEATTTLGNIASDNGSLASDATARTDADGRVSFTVAYAGVVGAGTVTVSYAEAPNGDASDSTNVVVENPILDLNLRVSSTNTSGNATRQFDFDNPLIVTVDVVDDNGALLPIDNVPVSVETTIGLVDGPSSSLVQNGSASFVVAFNGEIGAGEVTATYGDQAPLLQERYSIEATAAEPYTIALSSSGGNLSNSNTLTLTASVSRNGAVEEESIVNFATTIGSISADSAVTDNTGEATVTLSANGASGAGIVTATIETDIGSFSASLNVQAVAEPIPYTLTIIGITERDGTTESNTLTEQNPLLVTVELSESGIGLENRVIILEANSSLAAVDPENGASLTDANGLATFQLSYGGTTGAGTVIARFDGVAGTVSDEAAIEAEIPTFSVGSLDSNGDFIDGIIRVEPSNSIGYLGSAQLLIALADSAGQRAISTQSVRIESPCLLSGFASLNTGATVELTDGVGTTTYTAGDGCSGVSDEITATLIQQGNNNPSTATITLDINAAPAADERFITFISATPSTIALTGTGGGSSLEERSQVVFEVRDGSGNPVAGQEVTFELSRAPGGVQLSDANAITDANGQVAATVISGTVATPVRVIATTERSPADGIANLISVISDSLTISSGIVTQGRFALSADVLNPAAAAVVDGTSVNLTVSAFDRFGNAVPNGTAVSFTSECGGVVNTGGLPVGSCEIIDGGCNVEWRAQPAAPTTCSDNRVTIMAHALGEEAFVDGNADGYYNLGESFTDNSEAFRDDDESAAYEIGELFIDLDEDGVFADATPAANAPAGLFNGTACDSDGTVCSGALISVFANLEIIAGPQDANGLTISVVDSGGIQLAEGVDPMDPGSYVVLISDVDGNYPPLGTEISAEASGECEVVSPDAKAPNTNQIGQFPVGVSVIASGPNDADTDDRVTINVTIPASLGGSGNAATLSFACNP